jgi:aminopeptidase-like protein
MKAIMQNDIEKYFDKLFPICRSITGNGLRNSFEILQEIIPFQLHEIPTGTQCFDWNVPKEWNINTAYIVTPNGKKIANFEVNNLHILNYSIPVNRKMSYEELLPHLHTLPNMPDAIPYLTTYYKETWGFCLSYNEFLTLPKEGEYLVYIDSSLENGSLTYGDVVLKGETDQEIMFSSYLCHPSLANNELSGPLTLAFLYKQIASLKNRKYTYRFILAPETIGVIAYLANNGMYMKEKTLAGYVLTCCGDAGNFTFKKSRDINSKANSMALHILKNQNINYTVKPFTLMGSDERQYCSPGFNLPVASLMRSQYKEYDQYHTSLDNKSFISFEAMQTTVLTYFDIVKAFELNNTYQVELPYCEPQLGKRGLYTNLGGQKDMAKTLEKRMILLNYCDGKHSILEIAELFNYSILDFEDEINILLQHNMIHKIENNN